MEGESRVNRTRLSYKGKVSLFTTHAVALFLECVAAPLLQLIVKRAADELRPLDDETS